MKKRILALACAMTMVFGMSLSAFAATSPTGSSTADSAKEDAEKAAYEAEMSEVVTIPNSSGQTFSGWTIMNFAETTKISSGVSGATISAVGLDTARAMIVEANRLVGTGTFIASIVDLNVPAGTGTATFTLTCPNVWKGQKVTILHQKKDGTYETIKPSNVADNSVTFTMTSYSPIAIVIDTTSPKTADKGILSWLLSLF